MNHSLSRHDSFDSTGSIHRNNRANGIIPPITCPAGHRANEPCGCGRKGAPRRASCCHKIPLDEQGDGIEPRAVLFRKFHPTGEECPKCPFCCQLAAVSKLQKIANHPCLLQVLLFSCALFILESSPSPVSTLYTYILEKFLIFYLKLDLMWKVRNDFFFFAVATFF